MTSETTALARPSTTMQVSVEKARTIQSYVPWMMNGYVLCAWLASWLLYDAQKAWQIALWLGVLTLSALLNVLAGIRGRKHRPKPHNAPHRLQVVTRASLYFGVLWAAGVLLLWPVGQIDMQVFLTFLTVGLTSGALLSISVHLPAFYAYFLPCIASLLLATLSEDKTVNQLIAVATLTYLVASIRFVRTLSETFVSLMRSRFEVANLADDLQHQKEVAEAASLSKSRFLAAASHDLRQPVHSLSLFLGALARQPQSAEGERLVGHMRTTIESLETLFSGLLNISKLDAKTIQPELACIDLQQLLRNVCDAEAMAAQEKGLVLQLQAQALWVHTDAALLDRIVRNLLVNALRYTQHGSVVVSARQRAGQVLVRVADTGTGIAADKHALIFHEFVQLHNPERDRSHGLGLGLAIVQRLTELLHIPLRLRSRTGRGTVFSLWLGAPQAAPLRPALPASEFAGAPAHQAAGSLVIVIDDDEQIRLGTSALLKSWGMRAVCVEGRRALQHVIATSAEVPALVICDLRLRDGENGIDTVEYLRTQYNEDIPAILITGDTDPEQLRQAQASGLLLLHKPVTPEALKQAIEQAIRPLVPPTGGPSG